MDRRKRRINLVHSAAGRLHRTTRSEVDGHVGAHLLDAVLCEDGRGSPDRPQVEPSVFLAGLGHLLAPADERTKKTTQQESHSELPRWKPEPAASHNQVDSKQAPTLYLPVNARQHNQVDCENTRIGSIHPPLLWQTRKKNAAAAPAPTTQPTPTYAYALAYRYLLPFASVTKLPPFRMKLST